MKKLIEKSEYDPKTDTLYIYQKILVSELLALKTIYKHIEVVEVKKRW